MKSRVLRGISSLLIFSIASAAVAQAAAPVGETVPAGTQTILLPASFEEVPEPEADRIAPLNAEFWERYNKAAQAERIGEQYKTHVIDTGAIIVGVIVLDVLVNLGKSIWALIEAGRPRIDLNLDVASAVPQGIKSWTELDRWNDPISKLYKTQLLTQQNRSLGDVYYRLIFSYGGTYKGSGKYLTNVAIVPAQLQLPYLKNFYAKTQVTSLVNHGTKKSPVAGMTMLLQWGLDTVFSGRTLQSVSLHMRGDGNVRVLPSQDDQPETLNAPVRRAPVQAPTPSPDSTPYPEWGWPI